MNYKIPAVLIFIVSFLYCCTENNSQKTAQQPEETLLLKQSKDILNFKGSPKTKADRNMLMFSDQGAWFAYSLPDTLTTAGGFSGPFLMTQENGVWLSTNLTALELASTKKGAKIIDWKNDLKAQHSFASHFEQTFENDSLRMVQQLVFASGHTALLQTLITNTSEAAVTLYPTISGRLFDLEIKASNVGDYIKLKSTKSDAIGYIQLLHKPYKSIISDSISFHIKPQPLHLPVKATAEILISQTFIFSDYSWIKEQQQISKVNFDSVLTARKLEKENELVALIADRKKGFESEKYTLALAKAQMTLQNNWRIPAGKLKHEGLFPSYHYKWFHGFWSWDSWKHAVGLSHYKPQLAKNQIRAMFDYQQADGFILDCMYRDTTIEPFNYRNTKPPLAAWAVAHVYKKDADLDFIKEMYPKLKKYHSWWYNKRDHDKDGLCEYGSTDGTLLAAKWESGMDNAIRFDNSKILKNSSDAYSIDQESVDLNAYLYAEKMHLTTLAEALQKPEDATNFRTEARVLKERIQKQFYDEKDGWFYDTNLKGDVFIKGTGSEGWTPLWAKAATAKQAEAVKTKMMNPDTFFTKVPFQTMAKDHEKFDPLNGYWRGPNWFDQAYFGVKGLQNYGYYTEAAMATKQIIAGAAGILGKGKAIRENYHPITGEGREAQNFSWSAAHLIMLLKEDTDGL